MGDLEEKMEIVYVYQRTRKDFGRQTLFRDRADALTTNISPDPAYAKNFDEKTQCIVEIQSMPDQSEHEVSLRAKTLQKTVFLATK